MVIPMKVPLMRSMVSELMLRCTMLFVTPLKLLFKRFSRSDQRPINILALRSLDHQD
jgi:hypothetical protein